MSKAVPNFFPGYQESETHSHRSFGMEICSLDFENIVAIWTDQLGTFNDSDELFTNFSGAACMTLIKVQTRFAGLIRVVYATARVCFLISLLQIFCNH